MFSNKFSRHTIAFLTIALSAILLYPVVQAELIPVAWLLFTLVALAALLTLITK